MALTSAELAARRASATGGGRAARNHEADDTAGSVSELQVAIEDLYALATDAERAGLPAVEVARTWRELGDTWFALGRRTELRLLENSVDAYRRGERILTRLPDAIEGAELDLALAASFFELSQGTDTALLRRASNRLERSVEVFRRQMPERAQVATSALERTRAALESALAGGDAGDGISEVAQQIVLLRMLETRLTGEAKREGLPPLRRVEVEEQLRAVGGALALSERDRDGAHLSAVQTRDLFRWTRPRPSCGDPRIDWFEEALKAEVPRPMRPQTDRETTRLLLSVARRMAEEAQRASPTTPPGRAAWDARVFRLAIDVQAHLRRFNLMLATPAWTTRPGGPLPDRMFFAGRAELAERLQRTCAARGLVLLCDPTDGARPGELLWNQLRTSAGAVVDLGATDGTARASAYYGLALAVTAGTPTAVLGPHAAPLPVELEGCPVVLLGDDHDAARLDAVIDLAVCRPRSTAVTAGAGALAEVVAELERLAATCPSAGRPAALIESARRAANAADPAACRRAVEMGVAELAGGPGADPTLASGAGEERATGPAPRQPVSLSPWFAPTYPSPLSGPRRLLHAAGPRGISAQATGAVESACVARGFSHVPLEAPGTPARPHSLVGLWRHVGAAHAVLADLTERDPVVALVVGLAHAWGKPVRIVTERSAADSAANRQPESFPPLPHRALSTWSDGAQLHDLVGAFLTAVVRAEQPAASGQASQASSAR